MVPVKMCFCHISDGIMSVKRGNRSGDSEKRVSEFFKVIAEAVPKGQICGPGLLKR